MANPDKARLLKGIEALNNDELVAVLEADISFFQGEADLLDSISPADQEELQQLVNEPFGFETETEAAFKKAVEKWRTW
jgi:predicted nucleotidyltransferase